MSKSCEYNATNAFIFNGNNGELNNNNKYNSNTVRPVSEFCYQNTDRAFLSFVSSMYFAYYICRKNKSGTPNAIHFERDLSANIHELSTRIWNGEYIPKPSIAFVVTRPCPREVVAAAFDDRIVQHWVVWRLEPLFERCHTLDDDMFSCRVGKGNLAALQRLRDKVFRASHGYTRDCWIAKFDLKSFFMSIDKCRLYDELIALIMAEYNEPDKDILLYLVRIMTFNVPPEHWVRRTPITMWELMPPEKSLANIDWFLALAIGNLWSQTDANFYNAPFMRWLRSIGFDPTNYVDDFANVFTDKESFHVAMPHIREYLKTERGLTLHPTKYSEQHYSKGMKFLGGVVKFNRLYINNRTVGNLIQKVYYYNTYYTTRRQKTKHVEKFVEIINSYFGLMKHFATYNIRTRVAGDIVAHWGKYLFFDPDFQKATVVRRYRSIEKYRYRARRAHRAELRIINTKLQLYYEKRGHII